MVDSLVTSVSPPTSGLSALLSLSQAASSAQPIPIARNGHSHSHSHKSSIGETGLHPSLKSRRLSSTGQTRRRMSDARDAASRPAASSLHSAASALASLSLTSPSPPAASLPHASSPFSYKPLASKPSGISQAQPTENIGVEVDVDVEDDSVAVPLSSSATGLADREQGKAVKGAKATGKKRGTIFKCESCSKVYRHPSCLVKHRWEHSPHWREASKFLLSKHQQVQLLEAAAILSHLSPGSSLPDDRSLWPYLLSGGAVPPPATSTMTTTPITVNGTTSRSSHTRDVTATMARTASKGQDYDDDDDDDDAALVQPISSSVPAGTVGLTRARSRSVSTTVSNTGSTGPRMHNYVLPGGAVNTGLIKQIRPGLLAHPTLPTNGNSQETTPGGASPYTGIVNGSARSSNSGLGLTPSSAPDCEPLPKSTGALPMAVPNANKRTFSDGYGIGFGGIRNSQEISTSLSSYNSFNPPSSLSQSYPYPADEEGGGGWSIPRSDVRSSNAGSVSVPGSVSASLTYSYSDSRSRSGSRSDDEDEDNDDREISISRNRPPEEEVVIHADTSSSSSGFGSGFGFGSSGASRPSRIGSIRDSERYGYGYGAHMHEYAFPRAGWKDEQRDQREVQLRERERNIDIDEDDEEEDNRDREMGRRGYSYNKRNGRIKETKEEEWDGMDMDMEM